MMPVGTRAAGFTLIEILVAMALLVIGMTGILSLYTVAMDLQARAAERLDVAISVPELLNRVGDDFASRATGTPDGRLPKGTSHEFPLQEGSRLRCAYQVEPFPGENDGRCVLARIQVVVPGRGGERSIDFGYLPIVLPSPNAALLRSGTKN
jgi:prepilin-type N-terminal cleavage/methylation domain-containing protein